MCIRDRLQHLREFREIERKGEGREAGHPRHELRHELQPVSYTHLVGAGSGARLVQHDAAHVRARQELGDAADYGGER